MSKTIEGEQKRLAALRHYFATMTDEQKAQRRERLQKSLIATKEKRMAGIQKHNESLTEEERAARKARMQKMVDERDESARIEATKKAWADPEKRELRIKKMRSAPGIVRHVEWQRSEEGRAAMSQRGKEIVKHVDKAKQLEVNRRLGKEREGIPMPPGPAAKGPDHWKALYWKVRSPYGIVIEGKNLNELVRKHSHMFDAADIIWKKSQCKASQGLRGLFARQVNNPVSWHGWTAVMPWHPNDDPLNR